jgi:hypothetical protein
LQHRHSEGNLHDLASNVESNLWSSQHDSEVIAQILPSFIALLGDGKGAWTGVWRL